MTEHIIAMIPIISMLRIFSLNIVFTGFAASGKIKKRAIITTEPPPTTGRFTRKPRKISYKLSLGLLEFRNIQHTSCHDTCDVDGPPSEGPITLATPHASPASSAYVALFSGTAIDATMLNEPGIIPPPPRPASARSTINVALPRATPNRDI